MAIPAQDECAFLGWALVHLDDPIPKQAYKAAKRLEIRIEEFIDEALKEKLERMEGQ